MILDFANIFNYSIDENINPATFNSSYRQHVVDILPSLVCPHCHSKGEMLINTSYKRYICNQPNSFSSVTILVVRCDSCETYHAILPASFFPFKSFSYPFVMEVLYQYYFGDPIENKSRVCESTHISRKTLNNFIAKFSKESVRLVHKRKILTLLKNSLDEIKKKKISFLYFLSSILCMPANTIFLFPDIQRHFFSLFYPLE